MDLEIDYMELEFRNFPSMSESEVVPFVQQWLRDHLLSYLHQYLGQSETATIHHIDSLEVSWSVESMSALRARVPELGRRCIQKIHMKSSSKSQSKKDTSEDHLNEWTQYILNGRIQNQWTPDEYQPDFKSLNKLFDLGPWTRDAIIRLLDYFSFYEIVKFFLPRNEICKNVLSVYAPDMMEYFFDSSSTTENPNIPPISPQTQEEILKIILTEETDAQQSYESSTKSCTLESVLESDKKDQKNPIRLSEGGLFLIHPYIIRLLHETGYWDGQSITDTARAAQLLYYMARGEPATKQYQLTTAKQVLDIPIESTLPIGRLSAEEMDQVDMILTDMLETWHGMSRSGLSFLRVMFLTRSAVMHKSTKTKRIELSRQAQDILLEEAEWGLGIIKFPWHKNIFDIILS